MTTGIENLTKQHFLDAFRRIFDHPERKKNEKSGCFHINPNTCPRKYRVAHEGHYYAPKEVLRVAYFLSKNPGYSKNPDSYDVDIGHLQGEDFLAISGGKPTNDVLEGFGFTVDQIPNLTKNHLSQGDDDKMKHPLNQILYGPPGTGKTWNTVNHALAIIEGTSVAELESEDRDSVKLRFDKLKECGQIEMVTFHQNFAYEDFIEGIKPVLGDASGDLDYEIVDGVFKRICERAASIKPLHKFKDAIEKLKEECSENPISMKSPSRGKEYSVWHEEGRAGFLCNPQKGNVFVCR